MVISRSHQHVRKFDVCPYMHTPFAVVLLIIIINIWRKSRVKPYKYISNAAAQKNIHLLILIFKIQ